MRRLIVLAVGGGLAAWGILAPSPPDPLPPQIQVAAGTASSSVAGVWYCPWVEASFERDSDLAMVAFSESSAALTFPNPEPGADPDEISLELAGPGSSTVSVADVALRGSVPGFVEFSAKEAAAAVLTQSEATLSGDACVSSGPKIWHLPGGSTRQGEDLTLRLFNPFPETAKATVTAVSEFGPEPLPGLAGLEVTPRSWRDLDLDEELRLREAVAATITTEEGIVLPAFVMSAGGDDATWPGTGLSSLWEFPAVRLGALEPAISVFNSSQNAVDVEIDVFSADGPSPGARSATVLAGSPVEIPVGDLAEGAFGVRLRASGPVAAAAVAHGEGGIAGTLGVSTTANRWLLPGAGTSADGVRSVWLMNSGADEVTVTLRPLGEQAFPIDKVALPAGTIRQFIVEPEGISGFVADSLDPFTAGWSVQSPSAAMLSIGSPLE